MNEPEPEFYVYPAIDLRDGRCVRLLRGDYDAETVYGDDPVDQARQFAAAGVAWIHVVDLDAARSGRASNRGVVAAIAEAVPCNVQSGGGVRNEEAAVALFDSGVERVVIGTAAIENPALVTTLSRRYPGRVAVGLDARGRDIATNGWSTVTGEDLVAVARRFADADVGAMVVTEISRDGTMSGPDLVQLSAVLEAVDVPIVASGGIGTLRDLESLARLRAGGRGLAGAIVGRALYEGTFGLEEAVAACSRPV